MGRGYELCIARFAIPSPVEASCAAILRATSSTEIQLGGFAAPFPSPSPVAAMTQNMPARPLPQGSLQNAPEEELGHEKGGPTLAFS